MKNVFLGEYIKQRRLDLGLTQEQLCDGICEPVTLSRKLFRKKLLPAMRPKRCRRALRSLHNLKSWQIRMIKLRSNLPCVQGYFWDA